MTQNQGLPAEMGNLWDQLASAPSQASTTASARKPLRLREVDWGERKPLPGVAREIPRIAPALRQTIRRLVTGELPWPLFAWGPAGVGKTCAALALLDRTGGFYYTAQSLAEELVLAMKGQLFIPGSDRTVSTATLWRELARAQLVVLDEVGTRNQVSDHHYDAVKRLLDERHGQPLVVLSNLGLAELGAVYDDRVSSRLSAGTMVEVIGPDRRVLTSRERKQKKAG